MITNITNSQHWVGLSSDTKPIPTLAGSTFRETDTGALYVWNQGVWELNLDGAPIITQMTLEFTGAEGRGEVGSVVPVFDITGAVLIIKIVPVCIEELIEISPSARVSLGIVGNSELFVESTKVTDIGVGDFWTSSTPSFGGVALPDLMQNIVTGNNVVLNPTMESTIGGALRFHVVWTPLSANARISPSS